MTYTFSKADIGRRFELRDGSGYARLAYVMDTADSYGYQVVLHGPRGYFIFCSINGTDPLNPGGGIIPPRIEADDLLREVLEMIGGKRPTLNIANMDKLAEKINAYFAQQAEEKK